MRARLRPGPGKVRIFNASVRNRFLIGGTYFRRILGDAARQYSTHGKQQRTPTHAAGFVAAYFGCLLYNPQLSFLVNPLSIERDREQL